MSDKILSREEILELVAITHSHGGFVTYKSDPGGGHSPYELNTTYFDALNDPAAGETESLQIDRFMAAQAILISMQGVPGIYVHTLFGSRNWASGVAQSGGHYRAINRQKFKRAELEAELANPESRRHRIFQRFRQLVKIRTSERPIHPNARQHIIKGNPAFFAFVRTSPARQSQVLCIQSVSKSEQVFEADISGTGLLDGRTLIDLISGRRAEVDDRHVLRITVPPYGVLWMKVVEDG
jgi:glucosylglycerate phosphorylase